MIKTSEYEQQAMKFLYDTETTLKISFKENGKYFDNDKKSRDIYDCELTRGTRSYKFTFGNSVADSGISKIRRIPQDKVMRIYNWGIRTDTEFKRQYIRMDERYLITNEPKLPTAYNILAYLETGTPVDFQEFCDEYGYDSDSRTAERTHKACLEQSINIERMFNDVVQ